MSLNVVIKVNCSLEFHILNESVSLNSQKKKKKMQTLQASGVSIFYSLTVLKIQTK